MKQNEKESLDMSPKVRIMLAEDHSIVREGLYSMLTKTQKYEIICEAEDGLSALEALDKTLPDLLILDLSMPKYNGFSVLSEIQTRHPDLKTIVLTVHDSEEYFREAFEAGAVGYCLKRDSFTDLLAAIEHVIQGKIYVTPSIAKPVLQGYLKEKSRETPETPWSSLTQREKEVLKLIGEGYKNKEIAGFLYISPKTVEKHRSNLMSKLGIHNASALAAYAIKMGLVSPDCPIGNDHSM